MGVHHDRAKFSSSAPHVPSRVVSHSLAEGKGWEIWATLSDNLPTLAEAAPDAFLDALERDLSASPSTLEDLFLQEGQFPIVRVAHTGLLWALDRLAWSSEHFPRVALALARLAELDPGGRVSNRPEESLRDLFLPRIRFSEIPDDKRLETLKTLLSRHPRAGWKLIVDAYPSARMHILDRQLPDWRPWGHAACQTPTNQQCWDFIDALEEHLISLVQNDAARWLDLVDIVSSLTSEMRRRALESLLEEAEDLVGQPSSLDLWAKVRFQLHHHRSHPDAKWAMAAGDVTTLAEVYGKLTPSDPISASSPLFDGWVELPNPVQVGQILSDAQPMEYREQVEVARQEAVGVAYEHGGVVSIGSLAKVARNSHLVGVAVAHSLDIDVVMSLASEHVGSTSSKLMDFAHGITAVLFRESGWAHLEQILAQVRATESEPRRVAAIYLCADANMATWERLGSETNEVQDTYWTMIPAFRLPRDNSEDMTFGVQRLMDVHRSMDLPGVLWATEIDTELIVQVLERLPHDIARATKAGWHPELDSFTVSELFKKLDKSSDIPDELIAGLEIPYIGALRDDRPDLAVHREVLKQPALFADLISWGYKRSDGQTEEAIDEPTQHRQAETSLDILWELRGLPGLTEHDVLDPAALITWATEARRLCKERSREEIGDREIGRVLANAPRGADDVWPCEPVRDLLDSLGSRNIGIGLLMGKSDLRGITSRGPFDGGRQELSLAEDYRASADKISGKWPFTARLLRQMADDYERSAQVFDHEADWLDQFQS